jgi:hypothetical protein
MQYCDNECCCTRSPNAEYVMVLAPDHPQTGFQVCEIFEPPLANSKGICADVQLQKILEGLFGSPLARRVIEYFIEIGVCFGG